MAVLSNILRPSDRPPGAPAAGPRATTAAGYVCRPATLGEVVPAVRLILGGPRRAAGAQDAEEFLEFAKTRGLDVTAAWVAEKPDDDPSPRPAAARIVWALLPVASPGRTMLLSAPGRLPPPADRPAVAALAEAVCDHHRALGVELAQLLLDPDSAAVAHAHVAVGFRRLAELVYLRRDVPAGAGLPLDGLPAGAAFVPYETALADRFGEAILASYEQSMDCPALNGRRSAADILDGHMAAGEFSPEYWSLLVIGGVDAGVLLLNRLPDGDRIDGLELVYLGLSPAFRGRGWGDALLRRAVCQAATQSPRRITLAVDAANTPALRLYVRHGFRELYRRVALMRDLAAESFHI